MVYRSLLVLAGLASLLVLLPGEVRPNKGDTQSTTNLTNQESVRPGLPIRLIIPAIHVDAAVEHVGLTGDGAVGVPTDPMHTAWFNLGPRPGEKGSAVIAGHFGWKNRTPAIFDNLHALRVGDTLSVEDEHGVTTTFVVRTLRTYTGNEDATEVFSVNDDTANLNLITCEGVWDAALKKYPNRLVIFTERA